MATGAAPALDPKGETKVETKNETVATSDVQPATMKQRITRMLREIFEGREDHLGWRQ
jgi:hypothetical protein